MILFYFVIGTVIGSFLNVLIYRLPRGISIIKSRSFCPNCNKELRIYELIPIISFIFLRGSCSQCKYKIPYTYILIELLSGVLAVSLYLKTGFSTLFFKYLILSSIIVVSTVVDLKFGIIPNTTNALGTIFGILFAIVEGQVKISLYGILLGFVIMGGIYYISKGGMGAGDVKYTFALGAFLGPRKLILALFVSFVSGAIVGLYLIFFKNRGLKSKMPFGPYLSFGAICALLWYENILQLVIGF